MPDTFTSNTKLRKPAFDDAAWDALLNANWDQLDAAAPLGGLAVSPAQVPSTSLNVVVAPGKFRKQDGTVGTYGGATFAVPASLTTALWLTNAGVLTSGAAYPATAHVRLATVVAGATTVTSIADDRVHGGVVGTDAQPFLPLAGGTLTDGANVALGTGTGTRIGTATAQKLSVWGATPVIQPAGAAQAALTDSTTGSTATATLGNAHVATAITDSSGGTASGTIAAAANASALTDSTGGTASTTLAAITDGPTADAVASLAARLAEQRALNVVLINAVASLAAKVNALVMDAGVANDNAAKLAKLQGAMRTALVGPGLMKGSA